MPKSATCPICGKSAQDDYKPFCSKRCADVDLNRWFKGSYAVPAVENDDEADSEDAPISDEFPEQ